MPEVSVRTAWEVLLPAGTQLLGGEAGLDRPVTWPVVLRTHPPAFDPLRGGELAIIPLDRLPLLDPSLTLARVVTQLARMRIGGVCAIGPVGDDAIGAADAVGTPLFRLPDGTNAAEVHGSFMRALAEHRLELQTRIDEIRRELNNMAIEGRGRAGIVRRVGQLAGAIAALAGPGGDLEAVYVPPDLPLERDEAARRVARVLAEEGQPRAAEANGGPHRVRLDGRGGALVAALRGPARAGGFLVLLALGRPIGELDTAIVEAGVAACAIDLAREDAAVAARDELHGDFLDDLLRGAFPSDDAIERRGRNFGHDLARPHVVLALRPERTRPAPLGGDDGLTDAVEAALDDEIVERPHALRRRGDVLVLLAPLAGGEHLAAGDPARVLAHNLVAAAAKKQAGWTFSVGVGGVASGGRAIAEAVERAGQALAIGIRLFGPGQVTAFGDLGLYQLLFGLRDLPGVAEFHRRMLGPLIEHDRRTGGELLRTLDAYLSVGCSPTAAAERLHLHRNGLLYRLQRIREIVPVDLDDPERRLALHLALRIGDVLDPEGAEVARIA